MAQLVKNLPAMWEIWVRSLGWKDALEKGTATHSCILAWRIQFMGLEVQGTLKSLLQHHSLKASLPGSAQPSTSINDYWENHSFDYADLCQQSDVSAVLSAF